MKVRVLSVGKIKDPSISKLIQHYQERISRFFSFQTIEVRDQETKEKEGSLLLEKMDRGKFIVLDERGKELSTLEWKKYFSSWQDSGEKEITFVVGGAYGLSEEVRQKAHAVWALSKLTFTHELARLVLAEQIYRVATLLKNIPYHH